MSFARPTASLVREYGSRILARSDAAWGGVRATLIRRERIKEGRQRFLLPFHAFRMGVSGTFGAGSTTAIGGGAPVPLTQRSESLSFYPAGTTILNEVSQASRMSYAMIEIEPDLAARLLPDDSVLRDLEPVADLVDDVVAALVKTLVPAADDRAPPEQLYAHQAAIMLLLTIQRRGLGPPPAVFHRGGLAASQLARATDYLMDRLSDDVSLRDLADLTSLSPSHFCRAFKQSTGKTPHRWRRAARIDAAKRHLSEATLSLAEISLVVGFAGQSQFTTAFHRETGSTPSKWRAQHAT